ncbi:MAG: right-handed parallel beta-helix repeat-containing protein [Verrucomicrobiota bacterium]
MPHTAVAAICLVLIQATFAQGPLTPPGAPGPTMKTLDQVEPRIPLGPDDLPTVITESGSYYLTGNVSKAFTAQAIQVNASNVTLDLNGFAINGTTNNSLSCIWISAAAGVFDNIVVKNGHISGDWRGGFAISGVDNLVIEDITVSGGTVAGVEDFLDVNRRNSNVTLRRLQIHGDGTSMPSGGILIIQTENIRLEDVQVRDATGPGLVLDPANNFPLRAVIEDSYFEDNSIGVSVLAADITEESELSSIVFNDCQAFLNTDQGFKSELPTTMNRCVAKENKEEGFVISLPAHLTDCTAENNADTGFHCADDNRISGCKALSNGGYGFRTGAESHFNNCVAGDSLNDGFETGTGSTLDDCEAYDNSGAGIRAFAYSTVTGCKSHANSSTGISVSQFSTVKDCEVDSNGTTGIFAVEGCHVLENSVRNSASTGIVLGTRFEVLTQFPPTKCMVERNRISGGSIGISVATFGSDNTFIGNIVGSTSGSEYVIPANNHVAPIVALPSSIAINGATGGAGVGTTNPHANFSY